MKNDPLWMRTLSRAVLGLTLPVCSLYSQEVDDPDVFVLDPFSVQSNGDEVYRAQSSAAGLGFVVENNKLPIPINIVTSRFLEDTGSVKVEDALRYVSGASNSGRTHKQESYVLRGFSTGALLRNGERFNVPTDTSIIDRVEVLKGPAAIIYGTAGPAGLVNTVTKKPFFRQETKVTAGWDEYGSYRGILDYNTPFDTGNEDVKVAGRLIVTQNHEEFGRPIEFRDRTLISPMLHAEFGKNTIIDASYHHTSEDGKVNRIQTPFNRTDDPTL